MHALVAAVLDNECDDWWALQHLVENMPIAKEGLDVHYAAKPHELLNEALAMQTAMQTAMQGASVKFIKMPDVSFEYQQCIDQNESLEKTNARIEWFKGDTPPTIGVMFVGARLNEECVSKVRQILGGDRGKEIKVVIYSGNPFNVKDHADHAGEYTNAMRLALNKICKDLEWTGKSVALNVPTPPAIKATFHTYTQKAVIGGQPWTPTTFEQRSLITFQKNLLWGILVGPYADHKDDKAAQNSQEVAASFLRQVMTKPVENMGVAKQVFKRAKNIMNGTTRRIDIKPDDIEQQAITYLTNACPKHDWNNIDQSKLRKLVATYLERSYKIQCQITPELRGQLTALYRFTLVVFNTPIDLRKNELAKSMPRVADAAFRTLGHLEAAEIKTASGMLPGVCTTKDNWAQRLQNAVSAYIKPAPAGVVSDLANAIAGVNYLKNYNKDSPELVLLQLREASELLKIRHDLPPLSRGVVVLQRSLDAFDYHRALQQQTR